MKNIQHIHQSSDYLTKFSLAIPSAIMSLANINADKPLDASYQPGYYDVACGRGKGAYNRPGNKRFRALVATYLADYLNAKTRLDKSTVLSRIVDRVHSLRDPDTGKPALFVKYSKLTGWVEIGKDSAHEKVGHAMREAVLANEPLPLSDFDESALLALTQRTLSSKRHCSAAHAFRQRSSFTCRQRSSFTCLPFANLL
jgi:hypothetical protein